MTLEEKLTYMQTVSMEQARAEGNAIIDAHREALEKIFSDHKSEMMRQAETRIKAETTNAKRTVSQALAKSQLEIKRSQGKVQQELKDKVFEEAMERLRIQLPSVKKEGKEINLTKKEYDTLLLFARNPGNVLFREIIYERVWGGDYIAGSRTVDLHVQRVRKKVGWEDFLITVPKMGYRLEVPR